MSKEDIYLLLFGGAFVVIGLILVGFAVKHIREDIDSRSWPEVTAVLLRIDLVKHVREQDQGTQKRYYYGYERQYRYRFEGLDYEHVSIDYTNGPEKARTEAETFKPGDKSVLYVNPEDPEASRTERGNPFNQWVWVLGAFVFFGFGFGVIYLGSMHGGQG